jgi:hypothetical protein
LLRNGVRNAGCGMRDAGCGVRVAGYEVRVVRGAGPLDADLGFRILD